MQLAKKILTGALMLTFVAGAITPVFARGGGQATARYDHDDDNDGRRHSVRVEAEGRRDVESRDFKNWWQGNWWRGWHDRDRDEDREDSSTVEQRQAKLDEHVARLNAAVQQHQARLDILYGGVTAYVEQNNLTVENYAGMVAEIDNFKATSAANIEALVAMDPQINPDDPEDKSQIEAYREQYKRVVGGLIDYKRALHTLVEATIEVAIATPVEATEEQPAS